VSVGRRRSRGLPSLLLQKTKVVASWKEKGWLFYAVVCCAIRQWRLQFFIAMPNHTRLDIRYRHCSSSSTLHSIHTNQLSNHSFGTFIQYNLMIHSLENKRYVTCNLSYYHYYHKRYSFIHQSNIIAFHSILFNTTIQCFC